MSVKGYINMQHHKKSVLLLPSLYEEEWISANLYFHGLIKYLPPLSDLFDIEHLLPSQSRKRPNTILNKVYKQYLKFVVYPRLVRQSRADVYHILDHSYAYLARYIPAGSKIIISCHNPLDLVIKNQNEFRQTLFPWFSRSIFNWSIKHLNLADQLIVESGHVYKNISFASKKIQKCVIHMPISDIFFQTKTISEKVKQSFLSTYFLPNNKMYVLHVGRNWDEQKNVSGLLKALALITNPDIHLLKIGEPWYPNQLSLIKTLGLQERVHLLGNLSQDELITAYKISHVLAFPSWYEGFCAPPLEAMALGLPVVVSRKPPMMEVTGGHAVFCNPRSPADISCKLQFALLNRKRKHYKVILNRAKQKARQENWHMAASATISVYLKVLQITQDETEQKR
jgi:glycosyltransferase involved in cell wall biosynthesis